MRTCHVLHYTRFLYAILKLSSSLACVRAVFGPLLDCNLQAECGGWASCIGGNPDTTKCQGQVGWMQDEKQDARFIESAGGLLFPRSNIAAGTFWHYDSALSPTSLEFGARTDALARAMADRGVLGLCPAGCACSFGSRCGAAYKPTSGQRPRTARTTTQE